MDYEADTPLTRNRLERRVCFPAMPRWVSCLFPIPSSGSLEQFRPRETGSIVNSAER